MVKKIVRIVIIIVLLGGAIFAFSYFNNKENEDLTTQMSSAAFPVLYMKTDSQVVNPSKGYKNEMEAGYMRDSVTPLSSDGTVGFVLQTYGNEVEKLSWSVLNKDGSEFIAKEAVEGWKQEEDAVEAAVDLKGRLDEGKEYVFCLETEAKAKSNICFYTRVKDGDGLNGAGSAKFAADFSRKALSDDAQSLSKYMETPMDATESKSFARLNIKSTIEDISWGSLKPELGSDMDVIIHEINDSMAQISVNYRIKAGKKEDCYKVSDFFRILYSKDRTFVYSFERSVSEIYDYQEGEITSKGIVLGISDTDIQYESDEDGTFVIYEYDKSLYSYNKEKNEIAYVFGFSDGTQDDIRNSWSDYKIKIMDVDEDGNTSFAVYGYMNRGNHEGECGVAVFRYDAEKNSVEEKVFVPSKRPLYAIEDEIEALCVIARTKENEYFYLYFGENIYEIDLSSRNREVLCSGVDESAFAISDTGHVLAWQSEGQVHEGKTVTVKNIKTEKTEVYSAGPDEYIMPVGFMEEDFLYGLAKEEDVAVNDVGTVTFPMYVMNIVHDGQEKSYQEEKRYVKDVEILDSVIRLHRVKKNKSGTYSDKDVFTINNTEVKDEKAVKVSSFTEDSKKRQEVRLEFVSVIKELEPKVRQPKQVAFESSRDVQLDEESAQVDKFYVFGLGEFRGTYLDVPSAIETADKYMGSVVSKSGASIWARKGEKSYATIESLEGTKKEEGEEDMAACIRAMLEYMGQEGGFSDSEENTVYQVLNQNSGGRAIDLSGCKLDELLYTLSEGRPVIGMKKGGKPLLIIGYDSANILVYDPEENGTKYVGKNDASAMFKNNNYTFLSYD